VKRKKGYQKPRFSQKTCPENERFMSSGSRGKLSRGEGLRDNATAWRESPSNSKLHPKREKSIREFSELTYQSNKKKPGKKKES